MSGKTLLRRRGRRLAAAAAAQLVERRVARDREQQRAGAATPRVEPAASTHQPLESERRHVLGARAVPQQREGVAVHIGDRLAIQRFEGRRTEFPMALGGPLGST